MNFEDLQSLPPRDRTGGIFEYFGCLYNLRRLYSLGQTSPVEHEQARMKGVAVA